MKIPSILLISICLLSCSSEPDNTDPTTSNCAFENQTLTGEILNTSFDIIQGTASFYDAGDEYQIFLFGTDELLTLDPCDMIGAQGTQITFFTDNKTGEGNDTATLYNASSMELKTSAVCFTIDNISADVITGKLTIEDTQDGNNVSGNWEAIICN